MNRILAQVTQDLVDTLPLNDASKTENSGPIVIIVQLAFAIIGVIALINIVLAGVTLITSNGKPEALNKAKNTLIYAAVGLVVAILAETVVALVINRL